uniref:E3 ubiquitin-protein ligase MIB2-like n=1 Tax=Elaeis guineensis var. tenera TaxID=51953 RepID=A0A6I9S415_ELAGV|nr:E3 ubiquitin-protein ligase MIB2-like [Elaeis guineensis]
MAGVAIGSGEETRREDDNTSRAQREDAIQELEKRVYAAVMEGKWRDVAHIYKTNKSVPTTINRVGDTILHLAILMGIQKGVIELMTLMEEQDKGRMENILQTKNDWGNTTLHQAAFMGMEEVCAFIAEHHCKKKVVLPRNNLGETPLHVAVLHGHEKAFLALQKVIDRQHWREVDRKYGGDTVLHSAIFREHFGE